MDAQEIERMLLDAFRGLQQQQPQGLTVAPAGPLSTPPAITGGDSIIVNIDVPTPRARKPRARETAMQNSPLPAKLEEATLGANLQEAVGPLAEWINGCLRNREFQGYLAYTGLDTQLVQHGHIHPQVADALTRMAARDGHPCQSFARTALLNAAKHGLL